MRQAFKPLSIAKQLVKKITSFFQKILNIFFNKPTISASNFQENPSIRNKLENMLRNNYKSNLDSPFLKLPKYVHFSIMEHLSAQDLGRISQVSIKFNTLLQDEHPWQRLALRVGIPLLYSGQFHAKKEVRFCFINCRYSRFFNYLFGDLNIIHALPLLKYDQPIVSFEDNYLNLDSLTTDLLKGNKIMRGIGVLRHNEKFARVSFIVLCVKRIKDTQEEMESIPKLEAYAIYFNPFHTVWHDPQQGIALSGQIGFTMARVGNGHKFRRSKMLEIGLSPSFLALKELITTESCKSVELGLTCSCPVTSDNDNVTLMLTDQSEFNNEIKMQKRLSNK